MKILVLNGPNLNLLGHCHKEIYGSKSLESIVQELHDGAAASNAVVEHLQSNHEGVLIDRVHGAILNGGVDAIIFNPGPLRHTSVGLADAIEAFDRPVYEVHVVRKGEAEFRHPTILKADRQFCGPAESIYQIALKKALLSG
jgi:3-dehydroquinate dehydratase-2